MQSHMFMIPNNELIIPRYAKKCSFCRCETHNVSFCNHESLFVFYNYLQFLKPHFMTINNNIMVFAIQNVENTLYDFYNESESNKKILRSVGCRFYRIRMRERIEIIINNIILLLFDINISYFSSSNYNTIVFNRNTPIRISYVLNNMVINYVDINNSVNTEEKNKINIYKDCEIKLQECCDIDIKNNNNVYIECSICYEPSQKTNFVSLDCNHEYCINCTEQFMNQNIASCPFCRNKIEKLICYTEELYNKLNANKVRDRRFIV